MNTNPLRALVVDDEECVRRLTIRALREEGFQCEAAVDGVEAARLVTKFNYDVVVTDLRMPNRHGYALAIELLQAHPRPIVVVLTAVEEPRLVKDLLSRGVDDVSFKPVDYAVFAAKVKALVECQLDHDEPPNGVPDFTAIETSTSEVAEEESEPSISLAEIEGKLSLLSRVLPVSEAALDVFHLARSKSSNAQQLAAAVQRDASLSAEVLRRANSSFYNPSGKSIVELDYAVARIGHRRLGEMALASNALATLTARQLPWLNVGGSWRRSIGAGVAIELLLAQHGKQENDDGLLLCSIMHDVGRVLLGTLYPKHYERMVRCSLERGESLLEQERRLFPENHAKTAARLLEAWNLPAVVFEPLRYILDSYRSLPRLAEPLRTQVELVKLATFFGQLASQSWEPWGLVEPPPASTLRRLGIYDAAAIVEQSQTDSELVLGFSATRDKRVQLSQLQCTNRGASRLPIQYCNQSNDSFDSLNAILPSMGLEVSARCFEDLEGPTLINALGADSRQLVTRLDEHRKQGELLIVCDNEAKNDFEGHGTTIEIPCSWRALRDACHKLATPLHSVAECRSGDQSSFFDTIA